MNIRIEQEFNSLALSDFSSDGKPYHIGIRNHHEVTSIGLSKDELIKLRNGIDKLLKDKEEK